MAEQGLKRFMGFTLYVVEPGTVIIDDRTGQQETVDEDGAVIAASRIYCCRAVYFRLVKEFENGAKPPG
jgi:hypothetical protein